MQHLSQIDVKLEAEDSECSDFLRWKPYSYKDRLLMMKVKYVSIRTQYMVGDINFHTCNGTGLCRNRNKSKFDSWDRETSKWFKKDIWQSAQGTFVNYLYHTCHIQFTKLGQKRTLADNFQLSPIRTVLNGSISFPKVLKGVHTNAVWKRGLLSERQHWLMNWWTLGDTSTAISWECMINTLNTKLHGWKHPKHFLCEWKGL